MNEIKIRAPFQFVPFSEKVLIPYRSEQELPSHHEIRPDLKSGEIHVALRAETPVFVSDGKDYPDKTKRFFRGANGNFMIPGSTVRGMLRENMQILGLGVIRPVEDMEDERIYFRAVADASGSTAKRVKEHYWNALGYKPDEKHPNPEKVKSGWLCKENGAYIIYPTREKFIRVSRDHPDVVKHFKIGDPLRVREENARTVAVAYAPNAERIVPRDKAEPGMAFGTLLYTGCPVRGRDKNGKPKKLNHLYLFPEMDATSGEAESLKEEDKLSYQTDWERRKNVLGDRRNFWKLPESDGERKPVFYIRVRGRLYFGMSLFLRIGYPYSLADGLPPCHKEHFDSLDYPRAILGFAKQDGSAYRSRVSVGDMEAVGNPSEGAKVSMVLGNPKPSWYPGYTENGADYTQKDFTLRGYKQYWLKEPEKTSVKEGKEKVGTAFRPLPAGTEFQGVIRYRNLTEAELGLLLWCLRLEEDCYQTVGMGKPYGYGRMKLTLVRLREWNPKTLYGADLSASPFDEFKGKRAAEFARKRIAAYQAAAAKQWNAEAGEKERKSDSKTKRRKSADSEEKIASIAELPQIKDFFFIKRKIWEGKDAEKVSYLQLEKMEDGRKINEYTECKNTKQSLPLLSEEREKTERTMDDWLQALKNQKRGL